MGTPIGQTASTPSVKLRNIGDYVTVALIDLEVVPWTEFSGPRKGLPKLGQDGKARTQEKVSAVVINGSGVVGEDEVVKPDDVVSIYFAGHRRWEWIEARTKIAGGLQCGDVLRVKYERDEPGQGNEPKKVWSVQLRHPKPEESALAQRCEELRTGAQQRTTIGGAAADGWDDEEPFVSLGERNVRDLHREV